MLWKNGCLHIRKSGLDNVWLLSYHKVAYQFNDPPLQLGGHEQQVLDFCCLVVRPEPWLDWCRDCQRGGYEERHILYNYTYFLGTAPTSGYTAPGTCWNSRTTPAGDLAFLFWHFWRNLDSYILLGCSMSFWRVQLRLLYTIWLHHWNRLMCRFSLSSLNCIVLVCGCNCNDFFCNFLLGVKCWRLGGWYGLAGRRPHFTILVPRLNSYWRDWGRCHEE